jgi:large subunit ribosomal protein L15
MGTELHTLSPPAGARKKKKRIGRGIGSGTGKTAGKGMKGQLARNAAMRVSFEGGQLPIHRRVPKRGFVNIHRVEVYALNIDLLEKHFDAGAEVTPEILHERGLVPKKANVIKLLGTGDLTKKLSVKVHRASGSATAKVEGAGGSVEILTKSSGDAA